MATVLAEAEWVKNWLAAEREGEMAEGRKKRRASNKGDDQ